MAVKEKAMKQEARSSIIKLILLLFFGTLF
jgi:hypothetical protein